MNKFFVGQRVRIKWSEGWPELAGQEGRVVGLGAPINVGAWSGKSGLVVAPDCWGTEVAPYLSLMGATRFTPVPEALEPILPEGHRAGEEGTCEPLDKLLSEVSRETV